MCLAVPRRVLRVSDGRAEVVLDRGQAWVHTSLLADVAPGDYVLVYAGHALQKIRASEAEEALRFDDELERLLEDAAARDGSAE